MEYYAGWQAYPTRFILSFLIMNVNDTYDQADVSRCNETYPIFIELHDMEIERLKHILMPTSAGVK